MFSAEYLESGFFLILNKAKNNVRPPTRPKNINNINISFDTTCNCGVMPSDNPTVPIAEAVSYKHGSNSSPSILQIITDPKRNNETYIIKMATELFTASLSTLRRNNSVSSFFLNSEMTVANNIAKVDVFIPPAVDPDEPPTNIKIIIVSKPT